MKRANKLSKASLTNRQKWERYRHTDRYRRARNKTSKGGKIEPAQWREKYGVFLPYDPKLSWDDLAKKSPIYSAGQDGYPSAVRIIEHPPTLPFGPPWSEKIDPTEKMALSIELKHDLESILDEVRAEVRNQQKLRKKTGKPVRRSPKQSQISEKDLVVWFVGVLMQSGAISPNKLARLGAAFPKSSKTVQVYRNLFEGMSPEKMGDMLQMLSKPAKVIFSSPLAESQEYRSQRKKIHKAKY